MDTDKLKPFNPRPFPELEADTQLFIAEQLRLIGAALKSTQEIMKALEARMVTGGI